MVDAVMKSEETDGDIKSDVETKRKKEVRDEGGVYIVLGKCLGVKALWRGSCVW
jgi:hypothetical protein